MSTFKLSKNQEFQFLKGNDRFFSLLYSFNNDIDVNKLKNACEIIIQSTELFHYNLLDVSASFPLQTKGSPKIIVKEISDPDFSVERFYQSIENNEININPFKDKNLCISLIRSSKVYLRLDASSIYFDYYSANLLFKRIIDVYVSQQSETNEEIDYFSYAEWQNEILDDDGVESNVYYQKSGDCNMDPRLGFDANRSFVNPKIYVNNLLNCNKKSSSSDNLVAATLKLMSYYFNNKNFSIGVVPYQRNHEILNKTIGLINTSIPVFFSSEENPGLSEILSMLDEARTNRDNFNYTLLDKSFDNIKLVYFEVPNSSCLTKVGARFEAFLPSNKIDDLSILFIDLGDEISVRIVCPEHQDSEWNQIFADQLHSFLYNFCNVGKLELSATQKQIDFYRNNLWSIPFKLTNSEHKDVLSLISSSFKKYASNECLVYEDNSLSYAEVNDLSNRMSSYLINTLGVKRGDMVALILPRSINQIIALLAIIKTGACFITIDPSLPEPRKDFIKEDASVKCTIDSIVMEKFNGESFINSSFNLSLNSDDPFYCIYTSGSTGLPKGCLINQRNIINYLSWLGEYWNGNEQSRVGYFTPLSFDFTITSILGTFLSGSSLCIWDEDADLSVVLNQLIDDTQVGVIKITPAHIGLLNKDLLQKATPKVFIVGGEALSKKQIEHLRHNKECRIYNEYGPTEATVGCIVQLIDNTNEPYIGKPIPGMQVIVVDEFNEPLPIGCTGEILLGGESVINDYLKPSQQTAEKFINVLGMKGKFYRTGDLGRLTGSGYYEYFGRLDDQIKLNGYRIELAEVEANIKNIQHIRDAAVLVHSQNENKQLIAFWVSDFENIDFVTELRKTLPVYMVPSRYVKLDFLPLNKNGKVDKKMLSGIPLEIEKSITPLDTKSEYLIADAISDELKIDRFKIGKESNFISLGGDSIKAIQILATLRKSQYLISLQDLMGGKTISYLSRNLRSIHKQANQNPVSGNVELGPVQNLFLGNTFIQGTLKNKSFFNQSQLLEINKELSAEDLKDIIKKLNEHHDMMRSSFYIDSSNSISQKIKEIGETDCRLEVLDFSAFSGKDLADLIEKNCETLKLQINLLEGDLTRFALIHTNEINFFFITAHHLIVDLVSWNIILEDLDLLMTQIQNQKKLKLKLKTDSYQLWSNTIKRKSIELNKSDDKFFWNNILNESVNEIASNKKGFSFNNSETIELLVPSEIGAKFERIIKQNQNLNIQSVILRSLCDGLASAFGKGSYRVHLEGHGRNALGDTDLSRTVGWFTNIYPVVVSCEKEHSSIEDYFSLSYNLSNLPMDGLSYGMLEQANQLKQGNPVSWIEFNYLGNLLDHENSYSNFSISRLSHGFEASNELNHMADFSVLAYHKNENLLIEFNYNTNTIDKWKMQMLADKTKERIEQFTPEFENSDIKFLTVSPFTTKGILYNVVKQIESELGKIEDILVLSPLQSGMYFHALAEENDRAYFWQYAYKINNNVNRSLFKDAFVLLLKRHQVLRTIFRNDLITQPVQIILKEPKVDFRFDDISNISVDEQKVMLANFKDADIKEGFDIANGPLIRLHLIKLSENVFFRIWSNHHLLLDGWSTQAVLKELDQIYFGLHENITLNLPDLPAFSSYINWYQNLPITESKDYWKEYLDGYEYSLSVPGDLVKKSKEYIPSDYFFKIDSNVTARLNAFAADTGVTLNALVQCLWGLIIARYNQVDDVVFGSVISGRSTQIADADKIVGMLINTIPNRIRFESKTSFKSLLEHTFKLFVEGEPNHYLPLFEIQKQSSLGKDLVQTVITYVNYPLSESDNSKTSHSKGFSIDEDSISVYETTQFDLNILVYHGVEFEFNFKYNSAVYSIEAIVSISNLWNELFKRILINEDIDIKKLLSLTDEERNLSLSGVSIGEQKDISFENVIELLEDAFLKSPQSICISDQNDVYTYAEFWNETNQFANYLIEEFKLTSSDYVGICLPRSAVQLIALLGVIKTGSVYVPFDVSWPKERILNVVENCNMKVLINDDIFNSYKIWLKKNIKLNKAVLKNISGSDSVYCIFTSGSTGLPKGCKISHKNLLNYLQHANGYWEGTKYSEVAYFSPLSFDFTVTSIFGCWLNQGKLIVYHDDENMYDVINEIVRNPKAKVIKLAPAHVSLIDEDVLQIASSKIYILGGEALTTKHISKLKLNIGCKIINEYGPTEATVGCITHLIEEDEIPFIGRPINNTQVYLLNEDLELVPHGALGEIYIAGISVGQGYLSKNEITASRFLANPFGEGFLYKTGDLARWAYGGKLQYLGRNDNQVKINGYRIELEEIINTAESHSNVETFYVLINKDDQEISKLLGYYTGHINESALTDYLSTKLPDYMVPAVLQRIDSFELTVNGKIDKDKLLKISQIPENIDITSMTDFEKLLEKVWSEVLMIDEEKINPGSNFIKLGGDSIKAIRLVVKMREYGFKLNLKSILSSRDLTNMAKEIEANPTSIPIEESLEGSFALSPIQHLYFKDQFIKGSLEEKNFYNQSRLLKFNEHLTSDKVIEAIEKLMAHHDSLRLNFDLTNLDKQQFGPEKKPTYFFKDFQLADENIKDVSGYIAVNGVIDIKQKLNLKDNVLLSAGLYQWKDESHVLISIHHLAIDHISWEFIVQDFISLIENSEKQLPQKTHSYKKYCQHLMGMKQHFLADEAQDYWHQIESVRAVNLRRNKIEKATFSKYETLEIVFSEEESQLVLNVLTGSNNMDVQILSIQALTEALGQIFGEGKFRYHLEGHGRDLDNAIDVSRSVGWFTTIIPLLSEKKSGTVGLQEILEFRDKFNYQKKYLHFYGPFLYSNDSSINWSSKSWVEFNFLGSSLSASSNSTVTDETGNESSLKLSNMADLICLGEWRNGILHFKLTFENEMLTDKEKNNIVTAFKHEMSRISHLLLDSTDSFTENKNFNYELVENENKLLIHNHFGEIDNISKLTPLQLGMYFLYSSNNEAKSYHWQYGFEILGDLDVKKYKDSFGELVNRHGILKTIIRDDIAAEPLQIQLKSVKADFRYMDFSLNDENYNEGFINKLIKEDLEEGFDLSEKPPIRLTLVKLSDNKYYRLWSNHHIILDGWSTGLIIDELEKIYKDKISGISYNKNINSGFADYLSWLNSYDKNQSKVFWNKYLQGVQNVVEIKNDKVETGSFLHKDFYFSISKETTSNLKEFLLQNQITMNVAVHFLWALIISKNTKEKDVVFGSVVSGRPPEIEGIDKAVGMFINTIPVRVSFNDSTTLLDQLKIFQSSFYDSSPHHYVNLGDITSSTLPGRSIINNILTFEKESEATFNAGNEQNAYYEIKNEYFFESTNYNLNFIIKPLDSLSFTIKYNFERYSEQLISKLAIDWNLLINSILENPNTCKYDVVVAETICDIIEDDRPVLKDDYTEKAKSYVLTDIQFESNNEKLIQELKYLYANVLGFNISQVSSEIGFFEMGGHSINAIKILSKLRKEYGLKVNYSLFAKSNRIIDLVDILRKASKDDMPELIKIVEEDMYDMSPSQRRMWLLSQLENSGNAYNVYWGYRIYGSFQRNIFEIAMSKLIERHEILRTIYSKDNNGILKQLILKHDSQIFDIVYLPKFQSEKDKSLFIKDILNQPFDLKTGPVIKNYIIDCGDSFEWFILFHHIVTDNQTFAILKKEISLLYNGLIKGNDNLIEPLEIQYKDYSCWINKLNSGGFFKKEINYWKNKLEDKLTALNIPTEVSRPKTYLNTGKSSIFGLDKNVIKNLRLLAKEKNTTLFTILISYLKIVLRAYSNQDCITIGAPLTGRIVSQLEGQMGYYLNAVPILTNIEDEEIIDGLLNKVSTNLYEAYSYGNISFDELINELNITRDMSRNPIFDVWADYHNSANKIANGLDFNGCSIEEITEHLTERPTKFDLTFIFIDDEENVDLHFEYNTSIYSDEIANNIVKSFLHVLTEYCANTSIKIKNVNCVSFEQMDLMNQIFKANDVFKSTDTIVDLFYSVVDRYKNEIAVSTKQSKLTYSELNELSNLFADFLRKKFKVNQCHWVAVSLPRNEMVMVAIWSIIKLGAAYVPLELDLPDERKKFILNDVQSEIVVDEDMIEEFMLMRSLYSAGNIKVDINNKYFVYCIYTSGSTGNPKAVKISHDNLYSSNIARQKYYGNKGLRSFALYSYSFDSSVNLFFDTLLTGGNLYLFDTPKLDLFQVWSEMNINKSELLTIPPSLYDLLLEHGSCIYLKKVIVAGEECLSAVVRKHFMVNPNVELFNEYGPTECTVWSLVHNVTKEYENRKRVPIGLPISYANVLILNKNYKTVPVGALGELFISGPGVADDYKGNFINNEIDNLDLKNYYKTGDLVRINSDMQIEYISRIDNQLKIRGYRVEIGEIENTIMRIDGVSNVYVTHLKDDDNQTILIAYYTGDIVVSDLKKILQQKIHDYMIPTFIKKIDSIPLTLNGKVDESCLSKNFSDLIEKGSLTIQENTLSYELSKIWAEALGVENNLIYKDSDFFSLGGNSLKAIKLIHLIVKKYDIQMHLSTLFANSQFIDFFNTFELMHQSSGEKKGDFYVEI